MFETVLVAARGPLARHVVRTCQRLGARAVSVHSEADATARHVAEADDAVLLGPAPPEQSYLDRLRVLEAARQCGASAVHPGGGALAQDARLARAVLDAGLAWVGAPPEVLDRVAEQRSTATGDDRGRRLSVHLLAGEDVTALAVVDVTPTSAGELLLAAAPAAAAATALTGLAVRAAAAAGLRGVGSAELLLRPDGTAAVLELRPWLPVEHPLTALLTGRDLVEQQLRIAHGDPADARGTPGEPAGLLLRVYAEQVTTRTRVTAWQEPRGVRVDSGCAEGDAVLPWYDPLLATVTVAGATADHARARARTAVAEFVVEGTRTNLPRLAAVLADPSLVA